MASSSRPTAAGGHGRGITHPRSHDPTGAPAPITGNNNNSSPPSESPSFQILTTPPQKPLREIRLNPDLANLRYRTFDQCKWEDVVFAFEELIGGVWKNIPTPAVDPNTGCFDFRNCRVKTIQLTKKSVELLEQASEDAIQLVGVWCEDVRWGWPEKDIAFVWDGDGVFSTDPPLSRGCSVDGFWLCMFDFAKLLYPNMFLRKTFNWTFCREARFSCTILRNTSFRGALMHKANFRAANLKEANFRDAILWGTDFTGAYLSGCSLAGCGFADFALFSQPGRGAGGGREVGQLHGAAGYVDDSSDISSDFASCKIPEHSNGYERALYSAIWCYIMAFTQGDIALRRHQDECEYLLAELQRLKKMPINSGNWREYFDTWIGISKLRDVLDSKRARQVVHLLLTQDVDRYEADSVKEPPQVALKEETLENHPAAANIQTGPPTLWRKIAEKKIKNQLAQPKEKPHNSGVMGKMGTAVKRCCGGEKKEYVAMDTMTLSRRGKSAKEQVALSDRQNRFDAMVLDTLMLQKKLAKRGEDLPTDVSELRTRASLAACRALYDSRGDAPVGIITNVQRHVGRVLRSPDYYTIVMTLNDEIRSIKRILDAKAALFMTLQSALIAFFIGLSNIAFLHFFPSVQDVKVTGIGATKKGLLSDDQPKNGDEFNLHKHVVGLDHGGSKGLAARQGMPGVPSLSRLQISDDGVIENPAAALAYIALGAQAAMVLAAQATGGRTSGGISGGRVASTDPANTDAANTDIGPVSTAAPTITDEPEESQSSSTGPGPITTA